jgi:hypothetical protein
VIDSTGGGAIRAYDAANMPAQLWASTNNAARDALGGYMKFVSPTIVNGKVYAPMTNQLVVYGLLNPLSAFSVATSPATQVVGLRGTNISYAVTVAGTNGFAGGVQLGVSGLPANTAANFNPASVTTSGAASLMVTISNNIAPGIYVLAISGASGGYANLSTATLIAATTPVITQASLQGTNLVFSGTNGVPGENYVVLTSTNLVSPLKNWQAAATNAFDGNGNFICTNGMDAALPQQFFILQPR